MFHFPPCSIFHLTPFLFSFMFHSVQVLFLSVIIDGSCSWKVVGSKTVIPSQRTYATISKRILDDHNHNPDRYSDIIHHYEAISIKNDSRIILFHLLQAIAPQSAWWTNDTGQTFNSTHIAAALGGCRSAHGNDRNKWSWNDDLLLAAIMLMMVDCVAVV